MPNWCETWVLIEVQLIEITRYKGCLQQVGDRYYPLFTTVWNPELKGESELDAYIEREYKKNLPPLHYRVKDLEVVEISSEKLELHFETAY